VTGKVVRVEPYGLFVDIGAERPAMIHVSELSNNYVGSPSDVANVGDTVQGRIIKINRKQRKIDMSLKAAEEPVAMPQEEAEAERVPRNWHCGRRWKARATATMAADAGNANGMREINGSVNSVRLSSVPCAITPHSRLVAR
jgi:predicted RNA-binding protein with RPS1 domain